ncbi:MAG: NADH-quinone oxidoreductase subunit N [Nocardioidaceae bacterium]|nr:NADH-quinone oxidoreductase subunit N [Nocardioidaceae bacterium]
MAMQAGRMLPEIFLLAGALACLIGGSFTPRAHQRRIRALAIAALTAAAAAAAFDLAGTAGTVFEGTYALDVLTGGARLIICAATVLVICLAADELDADPRESETYTLLLLAALGAVLLAGANDLLLVITGYLLASIPLYGLLGLGRTAASAEAAMKTYLFGALLGIGLMLGVVVLYGLTGTTAYADLAQGLGHAPTAAVAFGVVAVLGGLMFKAGGVPGHFWVPDATQGSTAVAASFLTTIPKVGAVIATYRLVESLPATIDWPLLIAVLATASMTLGNLAAFAQDDPRRLLGWSTVSQVGYALVPVAVAGRTDLAIPSLLVFLLAYAATNLTAFAVVASFPERRTLASYRGMASQRPAVAVALLIALLGLVGTPPTAVFVGKLTTASAAWDGGTAWLAVVVMVNSVASLFYYLRWIAPMFRRDSTATADDFGSPSSWAMRSALAGGAASLLLGLGAGATWAVFTGTLAG